MASERSAELTAVRTPTPRMSVQCARADLRRL